MAKLRVWPKKYPSDDLSNQNTSSQGTTPTLPSPFKGEGPGGGEKSDFLYYQGNFLGKDLSISTMIDNHVWPRGARCYP